MPSGCCPGRSVSKRLRVGNQEVGISEYDTIMKKALELNDASDDELKRVLLRELKIYNYVPSAAEQEYLQALWKAFEQLREERKGTKGVSKA
ncbi:MAG: hypothetical protein QXU73_00515 [Thermoplasmata archaeon]